MDSKPKKRVTSLGAALTAACALLAACEGVAAPVSPAELPDTLKPPAGERATHQLLASGVQIYECRDAGAGKFAWTFVAPEAELRDASGKRLGTHYAGPTWESEDGSKIVGEVRSRADSPVPGAIPWLLLKAKPANGSGAFSRVSHVQRLSTEGGVAPTKPCGTSNAGSKERVPYVATYIFFTAQATSTENLLSALSPHVARKAWSHHAFL